MADKDLPLQCNITTSNVTLGAGSKNRNEIDVELVNTADESVQFSGRGAQGTLSLTISVGTQAQDFVATAEDSSGMAITPSDNWQPKPYKYLAGQATWSFDLPREVLKPKGGTHLRLTNFACNTDPGKAQLTICATITGYNNYEKTLEVEKKTTDVLQILYFRADPPQVITEEDKTDFVLEWNTLKADKVVLYKANNLFKTFQEGENAFQNGKKFSYREDKPSLTTVYKLVATDRTAPNTQQEKEITVQVLQSGWYKVDDFRGRFGYPSVLCNMNGVRLYGIFINQGKACLCSSAYPVAVWDLENAEVPEKMATSPAVCFANQLWLVGGSTADPRNFSNQLWSYALGEWSKQEATTWSPRMGHACVVFQGRVWVFGGMDANGNALNEVWSSDMRGEWQRHPAADWSPRCMQAVTIFQNRIWLYGGVTEPFGDPREDVWRSPDVKTWDGATWERYETIPKDQGQPIGQQDQGQPIGQPLGCTLQVVKEGKEEKLQLLGTFRRGTTIRSMQCILEETQQVWAVGEIPLPKAWDRQGGNTFSLLSTEYKGLIFLRSLNYQTANNPTSLHVYVP